MRYGHRRDFAHALFLAVEPPPVCLDRSRSSRFPFSPPCGGAVDFDRDIQPPDGVASCVLQGIKRLVSGSRMLTACPSLTPFGLGLGPTHPGRINLPQETLGLRRLRFSRSLSLLIPAFSLPPGPALLAEGPSSYYGTLPYHDPRPKAGTIDRVGGTLEPRSLSAPHRSTGELLRTL